jgi:hypothetical protein
MNKFSKLDIVEGSLAIVGSLLIFLDIRYTLQWLLGPGILCIGCALLMEGFDGIWLFRSGVIGKWTGANAYTGIARMLWTYTFILLGFLLNLVALLLILGLSDALLNYLSRHPGPVFLVISLLCIFIGTARILGKVWSTSSRKYFLRSLPARIGGVLIVIVGIAFLLIGLYEIAFPTTLDDLLMKIFGQISLQDQMDRLF